MKRLLFILALVAGCSADEPEMAGFWRNGTRQVLRVSLDLKGSLTQTTTCAANLSIFVDRDPFDSYAIRFVPDQRIFYPPAVRDRFFGDSFCSSKGSVPMCRFCEVDGAAMTCESPEQEIVGAGASVTHDCNWQRLETDTSTRPAGCGPEAAQFNCVGTSTTGS